MQSPISAAHPTSSSDLPRLDWVFRSSVVMFVLSTLTIFFGLAVQIGLAAVLGTGREMDAFLVAVTLPTFLNIVAMFTAVSALIPFFKGYLLSPDPQWLPKAFTRIIAAAFLIALAIVVFVVLHAGTIIHITAPGLDEPTGRLASDLLRIMILGSIFDIVREFMMAYLFSKERFFLPQFVPILNHCALLVSVLVFFRSAGLYGVAWAWTIGSVAMFLPLIVVLVRQKSFQFIGGSLSPTVRSGYALMLPALMVIILQQTTPFLDRLAASLLSPGAISYLGYGNKILDTLIRTIPASVGVVSLPLLSRQALEKDLQALRQLALAGIRWILLGTIPLAIFVYILRQPIILILFQRGNFTVSASQGVSEVMGWYAIAFLPASILYLLTNVGFALRRTWWIALLYFFGVCATLGMNLLFSRIFGPAGIAVAYLIVASLMALVLIVWFQNFLHIPFRTREIAWLGKVGLASAMFLLVLIITGNLLPHPAQDFLPGILRLFLSGLLGVTVYASTLYLAGLPEIRLLVKRIGEKVFLVRNGEIMFSDSGFQTLMVHILNPQKRKERAVRKTERGNILGVRVNAVNLQQTIQQIDSWVDRREAHYICCTAAHSIMVSRNDPALRHIYNQSGLSVPDGMAIVWLLKLMGYSGVERVYGMDLLLNTCRYSVSKKWRHSFFGGYPGIVELMAGRLKNRFPGLQITGTISPGFRNPTLDEDEATIRRINDSQPDILWVGLGCPKQERWMAEHIGKVTAPVIIGVGAAFDFLSGRKKQAPRWIQRVGLEWLFRLVNEPRRLWRRYAQYPLFVFLVLLQAIGIKRYD